MKRIIMLTGLFIVALTLVACGNTNDQDTGVADNEDQAEADNADENTDDDQADDEATDMDNDDDNGATDHDSDNDEMKQRMDELDYAEIEIEVDYGKNKEYEAEIEQDNGVVEADLEDELNGDDLNGKEAFDKIYPNVDKLTIDQDTDKEEAIQQTLDAFDLDSDYNQFEIEITFQDGTKLEFED